MSESAVSPTSSLKLNLNGKDVLVDQSDLNKVLSNLVGVTSVTVSSSRGFVARDFGDGKEESFQSITLNLQALWDSIPKDLMADLPKAAEIHRAINAVVSDKIARAQIVTYKNCLDYILERAEALRLRKILPGLQEEAEAFGGPNGFDPKNILGKKETK